MFFFNSIGQFLNVFFIMKNSLIIGFLLLLSQNSSVSDDFPLIVCVALTK